VTDGVRDVMDGLLRLRREAAAAGDDAQVIVCDIAMGDEDPIATAEEWAARYGGGGFDEHVRRVVLREGRSVADALRASSLAFIRMMAEDEQ